MKKLLFFALSGMMTLGMLNACKEHEASTQLTVTGGSTRQTVYADDAEGSADVSFETAGGWTSTITEGAATRAEEGETRAVATWITISPSSGSTAGDYTISITLDTNFTGADRTATITITSGGESITITVTQKAETEDGEKPVPEPTYNEFTVGGETFTMSEADSYMEYYGHGTNPTAEEMIVRLVSNDGHSACLSVTLPDGNQRLAPGTYTFYTGEVATAPAGRLLGERESFVYDNTADEMVGYFTAGTLTVSVSNTGDAIYTIAVDCTLDSGGKFAGTYRGGLAWYDESSVAVTGVTLNKDATTLTVGGTETLTATIVPDTATNQNVTWKSSAEAIATVDATGKIMAIASGEATITVTSVADATKTATCTVTVTAKETDLLSEQYITDKAFLAYVKAQTAWDTNGDGRLTPTEAAAVETIDVRGSFGSPGGITSLKGIEYFTGVRILYCGYNPLGSIDLSKNTNLVQIWCENCNLSALDVSALPNLYNLQCGGNLFTTIDLSKNAKLDNFHCFDGKLTSLDVSNNRQLTTIIVSRNSLTSLDVSKNTKLWALQCLYNQLTSLDISNNPELVELAVGNNRLVGIDISSNVKLTYFSCSQNPGDGDIFPVTAWFDNDNVPASLPSNTAWGMANGGGTIELIYRKAGGGEPGPAFVAVTGITGVPTAATAGTPLTLSGTVAPSNATNKTIAWSVKSAGTTGATITAATFNAAAAGSVVITASIANGTTATTPYTKEFTITVSAAPLVTVAVTDVSLNKSTLSLVESGTETLTATVAPDNATNKAVTWKSSNEVVATVDASGTITAKKAGTATITVTTNDGAKTATCTVTVTAPEPEFDVLSAIPDPAFLAECKSMMYSWDKNKDGILSVAEAANATYIDFGVYVGGSGFGSDEGGDDPGSGVRSLEGIEYFTGLKSLRLNKTALTSLDVSMLSALTELSIYSSPLTSLDVSGCIALKTLDCSGNQLASLDVSNNVNLTELRCTLNPLSSLDVSNNKKLEELNCRNSTLTSLDVSGCIAMRTLDCSGNQLTSLGLSNNTVLRYLLCGYNNLSALDISKNTALTELSCNSNQLSSLDLSNNAALSSLNCGENKLGSLDISNNTSLGTLDSRGNPGDGVSKFPIKAWFDNSNIPSRLPKQSDMFTGYWTYGGKTITVDYTKAN